MADKEASQLEQKSIYCIIVLVICVLHFRTAKNQLQLWLQLQLELQLQPATDNRRASGLHNEAGPRLWPNTTQMWRCLLAA